MNLFNVTHEHVIARGSLMCRVGYSMDSKGEDKRVNYCQECSMPMGFLKPESYSMAIKASDIEYE